MASTIILSDNGASSGSAGLKETGGNDGVLILQTTTSGGTATNALTIDATQRVAFVAGTAAAPAITTAGDTNTGIFFPAADTIAFAEGGTEAMRIDSSGRLLVGLTSSVTSDFTTTIQVQSSSSSGFVSSITGGSARSHITGTNAVGVWAVYDATSQEYRAKLDNSGNLQFNSGYGSVATAYGCRAWVNFNGTGTVAIRGSGNVSSITDNGTGNYIANLTSSLPDTNASVAGVCGAYGASYGAVTQVQVNTGSIYLHTMNWNGNSDTDYAFISIAVFR